MKKKILAIAAGVALLGMAACGNLANLTNTTGTTTSSTTSTSSNSGSMLGNILGAVTGNSSSLGSTALGGLVNLVIGSQKITESDLVGTWNYTQPACAFTSENLLAKAGGSVAAQKVNEKLQPAYNSVGISSSNTYFTFDSSKNFSGKIKGIPLSGTYTYDASNSCIKMKTLLFTMTGYVTRTTNGMSYTFESKKLLTILQAVAKISGNSTVQTIGDLSTNYEGVRVGFDMKK